MRERKRHYMRYFQHPHLNFKQVTTKPLPEATPKSRTNNKTFFLFSLSLGAQRAPGSFLEF